MLFRLKIAVVVLGGVLGYFGFQEWNVSRGATTEPVELELTDLEINPSISNNHIKIGKHTAVYPGCVYEYQVSAGDTSEPTDSTKVNYIYYPLISTSHPFLLKIDALIDKYKEADKIPEDKWPVLEDFTVLVKTNKFKNIGAIPEDWIDESSVQGLVINRIHSLKSDERKLLNESFPSMDLDKILIVQEGRTPASFIKWAGMMGGGVALIIGGILSFFIGSRKKNY